MELSKVLKCLKGESEPIKELLRNLLDSYEKKHWFEFQNTLADLVFQERDFNSLEIIEKTYIELQTNLDPLVIIELLGEYIKRKCNTYDEALSRLNYLKEGFSKNIIALLLLRILELKQRIRWNDLNGLNAQLNDVEISVMKLRDCSKILYAHFYELKCAYLWLKTDYSAYVKNLLTFIAYADKKKLSSQMICELVENGICAALISDESFNFNEIVETPILSLFKEHSSKHYLYELGLLFYEGNIEGLTSYFKINANILKDSVLMIYQEKIIKNIKAIALCDYVFLHHRDSNTQIFTFSELSAVSKIEPAELEELLIYMFSTGLVSGKINQVENTVYLSSMRSRALNINRLHQLRNKFQVWQTKVTDLSAFIRASSY